MDAERFDRLARALTTPRSRRRTVGGLLAGLLATVTSGTEPGSARRRRTGRDHDAHGEGKKSGNKGKKGKKSKKGKQKRRPDPAPPPPPSGSPRPASVCATSPNP